MCIYIDHCKSALREQVNVLELYLLEIKEPDFEFIRNHALSIFQFSDHIVSGSGSSTTSGEKIVTIDSQFLLSEDKCLKSLRDQIDLLGSYMKTAAEIDYQFVRIHAGYIVQLCEQLLEGTSENWDYFSSSPRSSRCEPSD
jgi:hypothetical protein